MLPKVGERIGVKDVKRLTWAYCDFSGVFIDNLDFVSKSIFLHNCDSSISHGFEDLQVAQQVQAKLKIQLSLVAICC